MARYGIELDRGQEWKKDRRSRGGATVSFGEPERAWKSGPSRAQFYMHVSGRRPAVEGKLPLGSIILNYLKASLATALK
jgi:hypothetical protein